MPQRDAPPTHVLTLVARPGRRLVDSRSWAANLARLGLVLSSAVELQPGAAVEWPLDLSDTRHREEMQRLVHTFEDGTDCDINLAVGHTRRKRLLIADMESTIIEQEMLDELAGEIGLRDRVADITERAMRGELDFEAAITERVALLAGLDADVLERLTRERITMMPGARTLVATMKADGAYCALVSGGFTCFTGPVAKQLGFDEHQANTLEIHSGRLTGRVIAPILGREAKLAALLRLCDRLDLTPTDAIAVGDGANDLAMLGAAGLGVAYRAKPKVREAARAMANGAVVTHGDLTALLYLQGYRGDQFITA